MTREEQAEFVVELGFNVVGEVIGQIEGGKVPKEWDGHELRQLLADHFARAVMAESIRVSLQPFVVYYGSLQGVPQSWFKEHDRPHFSVRELSTGRIVSCYYMPDQYPEVIKLFHEKEVVALIEGNVTEDRFQDVIEEIAVRKMNVAEKLSDEDFNKFFGCAPDLEIDEID